MRRTIELPLERPGLVTMRALRPSWEPGECAAVPMLRHRRVGAAHLTRLWFSLAELDDTFRDGGTLMPFEMRVEPWKVREPRDGQPE